jgi:cytoskeletal protein RodZ
VVDTSRTRSTLNRRGQALSEYAVLVAMVGMGLVVILGLFGRATRHAWQRSETQFANGDPSVASAPAGGGGAVSGSVQPTPPPPPSSTADPSPKQDPSDSSSSAADSLGAGPDNPIGVTPGP